MKLARLWRSITSLFRSREPVVLGLAHARAADVERRRLLRRDLPPSPMPQAEYSTREALLLNPTPVPLDAAVREVIRAYRGADAAGRLSMWEAIGAKELYTLFAFARRAAVFGMRERDRSWIEDGLAAVAMMDIQRMDPRDVPMPIALLHHAAVRAGVDVPPLFAAAAALAQPPIDELIGGFPGRDDKTKALRSWAHEEIATGFINRGGARYAPTRDLQSAITGIAGIVNADRYAVTEVEIATELPDVWIPGSKPLLRAVRGGATVYTGLAKRLKVYLVEVPDAATADALRDGAARHLATGERAMVGIARGNLFCLVLAISIMVGQAIDETPQTLQRFVEPIERVLDSVL